MSAAETLLAGFTVVCIAGATVFFLAGTVGLLRFPDAVTRLHALTKADNLGVGLVVLGLLPQMTSLASALKLVLVWLLVLLGSSVVSQLLAQAIQGRGAAPGSSQSPPPPSPSPSPSPSSSQQSSPPSFPHADTPS